MPDFVSGAGGGEPTPDWDTDETLFALMEARLYSAVLSDVLDGLGSREHVLPPQIQALVTGHALAGRAMPVTVEEVNTQPDDPYSGEIAALDDLLPNEICVVAGHGTARAALWGELFSNAARARGARGAIVDGYIRDRRKIRELGFPIFSRGALPLDCNGRTAVQGHRRPVVCGGVSVSPGDVVFADEDGIVVIPVALVDLVVRRAFEKVSGENAAREAIRGGLLVREAFDRYRVL